MPKSIPDVPSAGRLKHFVGAWMKITQDPNGYSKRVQNSILFKTFSVKNHSPTNSESKRQRIGELKVREMLKKGATRKVQPLNREFASNLFPVKKKMGFKNQV